MFNPIIFFCVSCLFITLHAKSAPFIDPCKGNDKECLKISAQKAIPIFADGIPDFGTTPLDPLTLNDVSINEDGLNVHFSTMKIYGLKQCQMTDIERNIEEQGIKFVLECPVDIQGQHDSVGKLLVIPIQSNGAFDIKSNKFSISVKANLNAVDNHWQFDNIEHTFEFKEKASINFEKIFDGDEEKARPVKEVMDNQWKQIVEFFGKPIVAEAVKKVVQEIQNFFNQVPVNELEIA